MSQEGTKTKTDGPRQKSPGYDDTIERDTGHDPSIEDPDPGSAPVADPDTEGNMGRPDDEPDDSEGEPSNYSVDG